MSNKKLIRNIVLAVLAIAVLVGALILVMHYDPDSGSASPSPTTQQISLFSVDGDTISKIAVSHPESDYTLVKQDDKWQVEGQPEITLNQSKAQSVALGCASISASQMIEQNPTDLAQYGLDAPQRKTSITAGDDSATILMGDGGAGNSVCYFQMEGDPAVYTFYYSKMDSIAPALSTLRDLSIFSLNADALRKITVRVDGNADIVLEAAVTTDENETESISGWKMIAPYERDTDPEKVQSTITNYASSLTAQEVVADKDADMAAYGFDRPRGSMTVTDKDGVTVTITVGGSARDESNVYAYVMKAGEDKVYKVLSSDVGFLGADAKTLVMKFIHLQNIEDVSSVKISAPGKEYLMEIFGEKDNETYKINGADVTDSVFKKAYQSVIGITFDGETDAKPSGEPACTVVYTLKDGKTVTIQYHPFGERQYASVLDGVPGFTVKIKDINAMLDALEKAANS